MATAEQAMTTKTACVIEGATPEQVTGIAKASHSDQIVIRANRLGTLVTGRPGERVIDFAEALPGPVYDIMYSARTGWFSVTVYRGLEVSRWDNRPGTNPGYPRVDDILGATTPLAILDALDVPATAIGFTEA
ncbi:MAG TPA: hypothetical protein VFQ53_30100 [Kofleriaceae bacterium]|nr:hypothetical protein [Kofleriaceae bacterium]